MIEQNRNPERDDVLFAFHQTCDNATAEQVSEWTRRYPQYADDIRAHVAPRTQWASEPDEQDAEPDESMLARAQPCPESASYCASGSCCRSDRL
jgi:hypothetical protein